MDTMHTQYFKHRALTLTWTLCLLCALSACDDETSGGVVIIEDAADSAEDTNPTDAADTADMADTADTADTANTQPDTDTDTDTTPDPCDLCTDGQVCVRNGAVTDQCFDATCTGQTCEAGEVCFNDACVSQACAGVQCESGEVCLAGTCAVSSCASGQVTCPGDQVCDPVNDACVDPCADQAACGALACVRGLCVPCTTGGDCGGGLVCDGGQCLAACTDDPTTCAASGEVCDPDLGLCVAPCASDSACAATAEICDSASGLCVPPECTVNGAQAECPDGDICLDGRCFIRNPRFLGGLAAGATTATNASGFQLTGTLGPVEVTGGGTSQSSAFRLDAGVIMLVAP
jgi:hypothetical protein